MRVIQIIRSWDAAVFRNKTFIPPLVLFGYLAVLVSVALAASTRRLLWNDELFTWYISTLPNFSQVWSVLSTGTEPIPPAYYAFTRASLWIFGDNSIALRLPSLIGILLMIGALYKFVAARLPPLYGVIAAVFPLTTRAHHYIQEARPYGLEIGFASLALLCWQRATGGGNRFFALVGLWSSLAAAISCHYFGVLLILPLAMGEAIRTIGTKRIDVAIWACLMASLLPLLPVLSLILSTARAAGVFWAQPHWGDAKTFYINVVGLSTPLLVLAFAIAFVAPGFLTSRRGDRGVAANRTFTDYEIGAILGFIGLPLFGVILAQFVTKAYTDRYTLSAVLGISVVFAQGLYRLLGDRFRVAAGIVFLTVAYSIQLEVSEVTAANNERHTFERSITLLRSNENESRSIVVGDPHTFLMFSHYAPSDVQSRLIYLADTTNAGQILGFNSVESSMAQVVGPWFHMNVVPLEEFLSSNPTFHLYGRLDFSWINRALINRGYRLNLLENVESQSSGRYLFQVKSPQS